MLLWLSKTFAGDLSFLNVFTYLTLRAILAAVSALAIALIAGPWMIERLAALRVGQVVRDDGPQTHF